jgi:tripartite-type tricarboxylate transporter receptor subunit TctC
MSQPPATGIRMEHIVYKSSPLAHIDLFSGQVHVMFDGLPPALTQIRAGRLRALAVSSAFGSIDAARCVPKFVMCRRSC